MNVPMRRWTLTQEAKETAMWPSKLGFSLHLFEAACKLDLFADLASSRLTEIDTQTQHRINTNVLPRQKSKLDWLLVVSLVTNNWKAARKIYKWGLTF